jgi:hypothetical protein
MKATQEQIQEWKEKHGTIYQIDAGDKTCYIFDPVSKLTVMKLLLSALSKGTFDFVDALINNCFIDGDSCFKTDDKIKLGLWEQVKDIIEIPSHHVEYADGKATIIVEGKSITVRLASRQEIKYAEDRNKSNKPLDTQIFLLDKIADQEDLKEWRADNRLYLGLLNAIDEVKDKTHASVKKL